MRLADDFVVDAVVHPEELRREAVLRFAAARGKDPEAGRRRHGVTPV